MTVKIGNKIVGSGHPCFIVAEIGINHNGSLGIVKELIDVAAKVGCDAVKFQKRTIEIVYSEEERRKPREVHQGIIKNALLRQTAEGVQYPVFPAESLERLEKSISDTTNGDLKYALEFGLKDFDTIDRYCREKGVLWYASAWDGISAHFINGFNVPCHKIASACLTHTDLLKRVRSNGKPVILSTGGSSIEQILRAVEILGREDLIILHCVANYPPSDEELNMSVIHTLKRMFPGVPIGYSGHEFDNLASLVAASMGACMIERHITLDRNLPGSDHKASIEPHEMEDLVQQIRRIEKAVGDGLKRVLSSEVPVMRKLRRVKDF